MLHLPYILQALANCAQVCQDPHLFLAHGGRTDFRGDDGGLYNLLSSANVSVNVRIRESVFDLYKLRVNGTFMTEAHFALRTQQGRWFNMTYDSGKLDGNNHAWFPVHGSCARPGHRVSFGLMPFKTKVCDDLRADMAYNTLTVTTPEWDVRVRGRLVYNRVSGPSHRVDVSFSQRVADDEFATAPHGLIGQSFDGDGTPRHGRVDVYPSWNRPGNFTTSAMGEGAIDGVLADYKVPLAYSTEFAYSARGDAARGVGARPPAGEPRAHRVAGAFGAVNVSEVLYDVATPLMTEPDPASGSGGRRLSECDCSASPPPPTPPPLPPLAPGQSSELSVEFSATFVTDLEGFNLTQFQQDVAAQAANNVTADDVLLNVTGGSLVVHVVTLTGSSTARNLAVHERLNELIALTRQANASTFLSYPLAFAEGEPLLDAEAQRGVYVRMVAASPPPPAPSLPSIGWVCDDTCQNGADGKCIDGFPTHNVECAIASVTYEAAMGHDCSDCGPVANINQACSASFTGRDEWVRRFALYAAYENGLQADVSAWGALDIPTHGPRDYATAVGSSLNGLTNTLWNFFWSREMLALGERANFEAYCSTSTPGVYCNKPTPLAFTSDPSCTPNLGGDWDSGGRKSAEVCWYLIQAHNAGCPAFDEVAYDSVPARPSNPTPVAQPTCIDQCCEYLYEFYCPNRDTYCDDGFSTCAQNHDCTDCS